MTNEMTTMTSSASTIVLTNVLTTCVCGGNVCVCVVVVGVILPSQC